MHKWAMDAHRIFDFILIFTEFRPIGPALERYEFAHSKHQIKQKQNKK